MMRKLDIKPRARTQRTYDVEIELQGNYRNENMNLPERNVENIDVFKFGILLIPKRTSRNCLGKLVLPVLVRVYYILYFLGDIDSAVNVVGCVRKLDRSLNAYGKIV